MSQAVAAPAMMFGVGTRERARVVQVGGVPMPSEADFAALYQARFSDLSAQLYAYLGDSTEAQDVVQEAFVRAWQRWPKISEYDDPVASPWYAASSPAPDHPSLIRRPPPTGWR